MVKYVLCAQSSLYPLFKISHIKSNKLKNTPPFITDLKRKINGVGWSMGKKNIQTDNKKNT